MSNSQEQLKSNIDLAFKGKLLCNTTNVSEYGLTYVLNQSDSLEIFSKLHSGDKFSFDMLIDITAVHWQEKQESCFEIVYHLLSLEFLHRLCLKIYIPEDNPRLPSVQSIWESAGILEREVWDMFGVKFKGHDNLRRVLLYEEFVGHPLRKDYPVDQEQPLVKYREEAK